MSEQLRQSPETTNESIDTSVETENNLKRLQEAARNTPETSVDAIEASLKKAESHAVSGREITIGEREASRSGDAPGAHQELKTQSYKRTMNRIQSSLNKPERAMSKIIHQPVVDKLSSIAAQSVARPSGVLGGSIAALVGSIGLLYFARHYGFTYNYLFFAVLFVVGFIFGSVVEGLIKLVRRP